MLPFPIIPKQAGGGELISYISLRSGGGASTIACHHAMFLAEKYETCLIDFNRASKVRSYMGFPESITSSNILNIKGVSSIQEILTIGEKHHSNVTVIPGVVRLIDIPLVDTQLQLKATTMIKKTYKKSVAVLDTLTESSWITAILSDVICVVVTANRSDNDVYRDVMEILSRLGCSERTYVILNQVGTAGEITKEGAVAFYQPDIIIPYDTKIKKECNQRKLLPKKPLRDFFSNIKLEYPQPQPEIMLINTLAIRDELTKEIVKEKDDTSKKKEILPKEAYKKIRDRVQEDIKLEFSLEDMDPIRSRNPVMKEKFNTKALYVIRELKDSLKNEFNIVIPEPDVPVITQKLFNDILGFGPLEKYFDPDSNVTDIMVNGTNIRVDKKGETVWDEEGFESVEQAVDLVQRMVSSRGKRIDRSSPSVKCSLHDGSRLIAHVAPATPEGIDMTIRRFRHDIDANKLIQYKSVSKQLMDFLRIAVKSRLNIIVAGGTSSGKTTYLNIFGSFVDPGLSIITIENPAELKLLHPDIRRLEAVDANIEGKGAYTVEMLVQDSLKMRPDIIIVGEVVGPEAYYMIQAMNTGHPGSLCTLHANSAEDCIGRAADMIAEGGKNLPYHSVYSRFASAVDLIIYAERDRYGARRVDHVCEVVGPKVENNEIVGVELNKLWQYKDNDWKWIAKSFKHKDKFAAEGWIWS